MLVGRSRVGKRFRKVLTWVAFGKKILKVSLWEPLISFKEQSPRKAFLGHRRILILFTQKPETQVQKATRPLESPLCLAHPPLQAQTELNWKSGSLNGMVTRSARKRQSLNSGLPFSNLGPCLAPVGPIFWHISLEHSTHRVPCWQSSDSSYSVAQEKSPPEGLNGPPPLRVGTGGRSRALLPSPFPGTPAHASRQF